MKERLVRLAKWNQRYLGAALLALVYLLSIGPASLIFRGARVLGLSQKPKTGWLPLAKPSPVFEDLKEQS